MAELIHFRRRSHGLDGHLRGNREGRGRAPEAVGTQDPHTLGVFPLLGIVQGSHILTVSPGAICPSPGGEWSTLQGDGSLEDKDVRLTSAGVVAARVGLLLQTSGGAWCPCRPCSGDCSYDVEKQG